MKLLQKFAFLNQRNWNEKLGCHYGLKGNPILFWCIYVKSFEINLYSIPKDYIGNGDDDQREISLTASRAGSTKREVLKSIIIY